MKKPLTIRQSREIVAAVMELDHKQTLTQINRHPWKGYDYRAGRLKELRKQLNRS